MQTFFIGDDIVIKFIVCDDQKEFRSTVIKSINKILMDNNIEYDVIEFEKYNKKFDDIVNNDMSSKIYILDIELNGSNISGIDISRRIRKNDWNSIIILVTSHSDLGYEALKAQIMLLDFISKFDNCSVNLERVLKKAIQKVDNKKVIVLESNSILHRVYLDDILYIIKDTVDRKCIIKTTYNEISVNKTMTEMVNEMDSRFYLTHRSCIVNTEKIKAVDWKENIIYFENDESIDLLARDKKRGLKEYVMA